MPHVSDADRLFIIEHLNIKILTTTICHSTKHYTALLRLSKTTGCLLPINSHLIPFKKTNWVAIGLFLLVSVTLFLL